MKNLKFINFIIFVMFVSISTAFAQGPGGGPPGGQQQGPPELPSNKEIKKMVSELSTELSFTEEQDELVLAAYQEHFEVIEKKISSSTRPERSEMEALELKFQKEIKALLTEEQQVKYEAYLKKNQKPERQRG